MVGSYMRFGDTTNIPDGLGGLNPYVEQKKIISFTNATTLVLDSAVDNAYTGVKYCISDPCDIPVSMIDALYRGAEWQVAIGVRMKDADQKAALYQDALIHAFEADSIVQRQRSWPETEAAYLYKQVQPLGTAVGI